MSGMLAARLYSSVEATADASVLFIEDLEGICLPR
jgi:hypothetical protein